MNIQQFRYVLAVAVHRHFETAADSCFISQSTLSTMISRFEDELGVTIFDRKKKPVGITREGEEIIERLKVIDYEISQLTGLARKMTGEVGGVIRVGCISTVAPYLLPLIVPELSVQHPELTLEIKETTTNEIVRLLKSRELDIGIISTPVGDGELLEYPLYREPFMLFDTGGMHRVREPIPVREMSWDNFWLLEEGHCMSDQVLEICSTNNATPGQSPNIRFKAGSIDSLVRFVRASGGQTLLPYMAVKSMPAAEQRDIIRFALPSPSRTIGLVVHQHFIKKPVLELIEKEIRLRVSQLEETEEIIPDQ